MKIFSFFLFASLLFCFCIKQNFIAKQTCSPKLNTIDTIDYHRQLNKESRAYLGMKINGNLLMEDDKNYAMDPDGYDRMADSILSKYFLSHEKDERFFINRYEKGFENFTGFLPGDKMYISTPNEVIKSEIKKYCVDKEFYYNGGIVFYPYFSLEVPSLKESEIFVCSPNPNMTEINEDFVSHKVHPEFMNKISEIVLALLKNIKVESDSNYTGKLLPITKIDTDEIKVLRGSFTAKGNKEYIVNYQSGGMYPAQGSDWYASIICIMNEKFECQRYIYKPAFRGYYTRLVGILDVDGDGIYEIIEKTGFWDGNSYSIIKLKGDSVEYIANAFGWGA